MSDIAISLKNVSKYYKLYNSPQDRLKETFSRSNKVYHKKFYATKNMDLEIKKGEILGIVGKNGSGKSTLLKLITGVLKPDKGDIQVEGKISALLELGSGFNPEFTGMQNIFFYGTILGFTKEAMNEKLDDIIAFADIGEFIDQPIKTYSSGMKSRLGFAVAVHIEPEILILDEVLAVGDDLFRRKCYTKMEDFFQAGKTILYVSHNANSINQLCSKAILLDQGNIIFQGKPKVVTAYYQKLLFSKKESKNEIINQMKQESITNVSDIAIVEKKDKTFPYNIPNMLSTTSVEQKKGGITISNAKIETLEGEKVNILIMNEEYYYIYDVYFDIDLNEVLFGMQVKTYKGQLISGSNNSMLEHKIFTIKKGGLFQIKWKFTARLIPNSYYIDMSVFSNEAGELIMYHKINDAFVFKIISDKKPFFGGLTHLDQSISIKNLNE